MSIRNTVSQQAQIARESGAVRSWSRACFARFLITAVLGQAALHDVSAQPAVSQAVGVSAAIVDEFGHPLQGNDPAAQAFGLPVVEGDIVQILHATDNQIYPPNAQGQPDPRNVVLATTRVGLGTAPAQLTPAKFGAAVTPRPGGNSRIFVRVFNAASLDEASFYGDSQLFTVKSWKNELFVANVSATLSPMDTADADGDGLNNSWERSYGANPENADSDGDGFADKQEVVAGSDLLDSESFLALAEVRVVQGDDVLLKWASTEGVQYRVEGAAPGADFEEMASVTGEAGVTESVIPDALDAGLGCFRVCAVQ
jgi:hypothetical protein